MPRHVRKHGVTLMETICVLAILGVLAASGSTIIFPTLVSNQQASVESSHVANTLRMARHQAITTQQPVAVRFQRSGLQVISYTVGTLDRSSETKYLVENNVAVTSDEPMVIFKAGGTTDRDLTCKIQSDTRIVFVLVQAVSGMVYQKSG